MLPILLMLQSPVLVFIFVLVRIPFFWLSQRWLSLPGYNRDFDDWLMGHQWFWQIEHLVEDFQMILGMIDGLTATELVGMESTSGTIEEAHLVDHSCPLSDRPRAPTL